MRAWIFWVCLLLALFYVGGQAAWRIKHQYRLGNSGAAVSGKAEAQDLQGIQMREVMLRPAAADGMWWVMHTEALLRGDDWRVRWSSRDNAPHGREVHWSSGLMWLLALLAWLIHLVNGKETVDCVQHAALLAGPVMQAGFVILFGLIAMRRWGGLAGGLLALALATSGYMNLFFGAGAPDHHGLVTCFILASVLALVAGGAGRVTPSGRETGDFSPGMQSARRWFVISGFCGAAALWVNAATAVPAFAGVAVGALLAAWQGRRSAVAGADDGSTQAEPALWRWWGGAGAVGSLTFYLLEYAPAHMGWRLEVNHPLYALALWGGGEWLARLAEWGRDGRWMRGRRDAALAAGTAVAVLVLPAVILTGGVECFAMRDAFLWQLHQQYIREFRPLSLFLAETSWPRLLELLRPWPLLALPAGWLLIRPAAPPERAALILLPLGVVLPLSALACWQERWAGVAMILWLGVALAALVVWRSLPWRPPWALSWGSVCLTLFGLTVAPVRQLQNWTQKEELVMGFDEAIGIVVRDVAWALRRVAGNRPLCVLSGPTTTTRMAYYGDFQGIGTLYWENREGLKTAGAIFGAADEEEVLRLCREHAVTHLVLFSWEAFDEPYARLHHGRPPDMGTDDCYLASVLAKGNLPHWLRSLPFRLPPELESQGHWLQVLEIQYN